MLETASVAIAVVTGLVVGAVTRAAALIVLGVTQAAKNIDKHEVDNSFKIKIRFNIKYVLLVSWGSIKFCNNANLFPL
jgi:hypothetical protein